MLFSLTPSDVLSFSRFLHCLLDYHKFFVRGRREMCDEIKRTKIKGYSTRKPKPRFTEILDENAMHFLGEHTGTHFNLPQDNEDITMPIMKMFGCSSATNGGFSLSDECISRSHEESERAQRESVSSATRLKTLIRLFGADERCDDPNKSSNIPQLNDDDGFASLDEHRLLNLFEPRLIEDMIADPIYLWV